MNHLGSLAIPSILACASLTAHAQAPPTLPAAPSGYKLISPSGVPELSPGVLLLIELEGRFATAVASGGGKAFAAWFADDAVTLNNGRPAVLGRGAIAANAQWSAKDYSLTWTAQGAQMGPSNDMGFTWGHYEGKTLSPTGDGPLTSGRYITIWRKLPDGTWKVAMDASANEPPAPAVCCTLPKP